ncbi:MAG: winged helix-turn-helix transcriptional regulator [Methanobacteriota archaeon]
MLDHATRQELYDVILREPGVTLAELEGRTEISRTALLHHLRVLERHGLVIALRRGRCRHFFLNGGPKSPEARLAFTAIRNDRSEGIARLVRDRPGIVQKEICAVLSIAPSVAHWHLSRLLEGGLVDARRAGRFVRYFPGRVWKEIEPSPVATGMEISTADAPGHNKA